MISLIKFISQRSLKRILLLIFLSSILASACKVSLVATYDYMIAQQIEAVTKKVDKFYITLLETTENVEGQRDYLNFAEQYIDIEVELESLLQKNKRRAKNQESIKINERILNKWREYKGIHKNENQLSDTDIEANKMNFENLMNTFRITEEIKKTIK